MGTVTFIAMLAYLFKATGHGYHFTHVSNGERQVYWIQYVEWMFTSPLILVCLGHFGGMPVGDIFTMIAFIELTIALGLLAAVDSDASRYAFWAFGIITFIPVVKLIWDAPAPPSNLTDQKIAMFNRFKWITLLTWIIYPAAALVVLLNGMCVNSEIAFYAVLDILSKGLFGTLVLLYADSLPSFVGSAAEAGAAVAAAVLAAGGTISDAALLVVLLVPWYLQMAVVLLRLVQLQQQLPRLPVVHRRT